MTSITAKRKQVTNANSVSTPQLTSFMLIYSSSWHVSILGFNKAFSENGYLSQRAQVGREVKTLNQKREWKDRGLQSTFLGILSYLPEPALLGRDLC